VGPVRVVARSEVHRARQSARSRPRHRAVLAGWDDGATSLRVSADWRQWTQRASPDHADLDRILYVGPTMNSTWPRAPARTDKAVYVAYALRFRASII